MSAGEHRIIPVSYTHLETLIDQEVNKTQPGSVIIREFEEVGDLTVTS